MADEKGKSILTRVPPQNNEAEIAVLCCCMDAPDRLPLVTSSLRADDFYVPAHQKIYEMIYTLYSQSKTIDLITVGDALKKQGDLEKVGGMEYLSSITDAHALISNLLDYIDIVRQKSMGRRLIRMLEEVTRETYTGETDPKNLLEVAISRLAELRDSNASDSALVQLKDIFEANVKHFTHADKEDVVTSHFAMLDYVTNGFRPGTLSIVAARPSMGKSAFVINIAVNVALHDKVPVAFFSLEMNALEIANRILASRGDMPISVLQSNHKPDEQMLDRIGATMKIFKDTQLYIDEQSGLNSAQILTHCRELQNKLGRPLGLVCIDYLQLMSPVNPRSNANRQQEVSEISRSLKLMAKELKVPIIALAQLSRESEKRDDHRPMLSDLRDSGAIEQDADMVMFIHRPDYYKPKADVEEDADDEQTNTKSKFKKLKDEEEIQKAEIIVAKNRQGPTKTVYLSWNGSRTVFFEKDKPNPNAPKGPSDDDAPPAEAQKSVAIPEEYFQEPRETDAPPAAVGGFAGGVPDGYSAGIPDGYTVGAPAEDFAPAAPIEPDPVLESMGLEPIGLDMVPGMPAEVADTSESKVPFVPDAPDSVSEEESQMGLAVMEDLPWNEESGGDNEEDDYEPDEPEDGDWYDEPGGSGDEEG